MASLVGSRVERKEDKRFLTGKGRYTADINLANQIYAVFIRSPHARAKIKKIDTSKALKASGVVDILTGEDIIECTTFDDVIGLSSYFVDIHHSNDNGFTYKFPEKAYQLPFRMIVPKTIDNLLIPGRSASGNREANAATRVMAPCMVMGHAAGAAAALSVLNNTSPRHLDVSLLQKCLKSQGAHLG